MTAPGMMPPPLVIVGCGAAKLDHPAPAGQLYTGQHFAACMAAATAITTPDRILILSAKHGLVPLSMRLEPYNLTIGQPGAVTALNVAADAARLHVTQSARVIVLASARYAELCRAVWPHAETPLARLGIGRQRHALAVMRDNAAPVGELPPELADTSTLLARNLTAPPGMPADHGATATGPGMWPAKGDQAS